jgi:uncharacterized oligopeptide transporter (OPT) family protein
MLMASLTQTVFGAGLPWGLIALGAAIGVLVILIDCRQETRGAAFRVPVLGVALGIYLPLKLSAAIFAGGLIAALVQRESSQGDQLPRRGLLWAAGLITGEALMGIVLAVPIALSGLWPLLNADPFKLFDTPPLGGWPGLVVVVIVAAMLYRIASSRRATRST